MFELSALLEYEHVVLQCHDNPDPDAIGDYIAVRGDDPSDAYVIEKSIFYKTYVKC